MEIIFLFLVKIIAQPESADCGDSLVVRLPLLTNKFMTSLIVRCAYTGDTPFWNAIHIPVIY